MFRYENIKQEFVCTEKWFNETKEWERGFKEWIATEINCANAWMSNNKRESQSKVQCTRSESNCQFFAKNQILLYMTVVGGFLFISSCPNPK